MVTDVLYVTSLLHVKNERLIPVNIMEAGVGDTEVEGVDESGASQSFTSSIRLTYESHARILSIISTVTFSAQADRTNQ